MPLETVNDIMLSLVVTKDDKPVGILRLADLFPVVAKMIRRKAGKPKSQ